MSEHGQARSQFQNNQISGLTAPPGLVWLYALVMGLALVAWLMWLILQPVPKSEAFYVYNAARVDAFAEQVRGGATGIVLLGDSRLRYAVPEDAEFARLVQAAAGRPVTVLRVTNNWAILDDFTLLMPALLEARPALVYLQEELLAKERARSARFLEGRSYLIWKLFRGGPWNPGDLDQAALQAEMRCDALDVDETVAARRERVFRWVSFDPTGYNASLAAAFTQQLETQGAQVRYLRIPITSAGQAGLPGIKRQAEAKTAIYRGTIEDHAYCDVVHMKPGGRRAYTDWLVSEIVELL